MKIVLTEAANLENGGYSWTKQGEQEQENVTGVILPVLFHNDTDEMKELPLGGFMHALGAGEVLVSQEELEAAGFQGFAVLAAYKFNTREFTIMED